MRQDFNIALICRIIPAIFHPVYCGLSLTVAGEIVPPEEAKNAISKVIMGVSTGMIIGVPITTLIATYLRYQFAMIWFALVTFIALIATIIFFPSLPGKQQSYGTQISVAKSFVFIISVFGVILLNGGLYAAYSYISKFLGSLTNIIGFNLSIILFVYGVASIIGNAIGTKFLNNKSKKTLITFPIITEIILLLLFVFTENNIIVYILMFFLGIFAGIGNDIAQYLMVSAAPDAPEFANGIFPSMGNVGVTIGTNIAGLVVVNSGVRFVMIAAIILLFVDFLFILCRIKKYPTFS